MTFAFAPLKPRHYGKMLIDPPWAYEMWSPAGYEKSPEAHYPTMTIGELSQLPILELLAPNALVWMWSTWPHLKKAMELMVSLGLTYKTGGAWLKQTKDGGPVMGTGKIFRSSTEPYIIGTVGQPRIHSRSVRNVIITVVDAFPTAIEAIRREHSRKPPETREALDLLLPDVPGVELFAREPWPGNDVWGNDIAKFGERING
jgi:N6-adenosine-specific RNA methylase IME4